MAASFPDVEDVEDGNGNDDVLSEEVRFDAIVVAVAVAVMVTVASFVLLGNVEPDVRLKMTSPTSIGNGAVLPLVAVLQVLLNGLPWLQQNKVGLKLTRNVIAPPLGFTTLPTLAPSPSYNRVPMD